MWLRAFFGRFCRVGKAAGVRLKLRQARLHSVLAGQLPRFGKGDLRAAYHGRRVVGTRDLRQRLVVAAKFPQVVVYLLSGQPVFSTEVSDQSTYVG